MIYFILEPDLNLDFMVVARECIEFRRWSGASNIQVHNDLNAPLHIIDTVVPVGSVEFVNDIHLKIARKSLFVENWPDDIKPWMLQSTYGECKFSEVNTFPIFIKPKYDSKLFMGELLSNETDHRMLKSLTNSNGHGKTIEDDTVVYWSDPINFICEWRSILYNGKIISFSPYDCDSNLRDTLHQRTSEAYKFMQDIASKVDSTIARIVDIGLTDTDKFGVVECANHITTAATYTTFIDRSQYYNALVSTGLRI